jgi:hypothetical protein
VQGARALGDLVPANNLPGQCRPHTPPPRHPTLPHSLPSTLLRSPVRSVTAVKNGNLGTLTVDVPASAAVPLEGWFPLRASLKHEKNIRQLMAKEGRDGGDIGEVQLHVWRSPLGVDEDPPKPPKSGAKRLASLASKTLKNVARISSAADGNSHGRKRKRRPRGVVPHLDGALTHALRPLRPGPVSAHLTSCILLCPGYIHVDIHSARGLIPADDVSGTDPATWTSDPYVEVRLLPKHNGGAKGTTGVRVATLSPTWHESLVLPVVHGAHSVLIRVFDKDVMAHDDFLGETIIPLPPRPLPCAATAAQLAEAGHGHAIAGGWFPLTANEQEGAHLVDTCRLLGRGSDTSVPGPLGEVNATVAWGTGVVCDDLNTRPSLRPRLGRLIVTIHAVTGLPAKFSDRPCVVSTLEGQMGVTPEVPNTCNPTWEDVTFVFAVTELTADLVFTVLDHDPLVGDQTCGEVLVPLHHLLASSPTVFAAAMAGPHLTKLAGQEDAVAQARAAAAAPRYAHVLPARHPGCDILTPAPRPPQPLGVLSYSAVLELDRPAWFGYLAPEVMPRETMPGEDHSAEEFSYGAFCLALGRLLDCIFCPMFAPLRTVLYLQSWQAPWLNAALMSFLIIGTLVFWFTFKALTPLWLILMPFLHGYVSHLIHLGDVPVLYTEEQAERDKAKADEAAYQATKWAMLVEMQAKMLEDATKVGATSVSGALLASVPGAGLVSGMTNMLRSGVQAAGDNAQALNIYKKIYSKLGGIQKKILGLAQWVEPMVTVFTWGEPGVTATAFAICAGYGLIASVFAFIACSILGYLGVGWNHVTLCLGLTCFSPKGAAITRSILDMIDYYLGYLGSVATITSLTGGAGLDATAPPKAPHLEGDALVAAVTKEATANVKRILDAREASLQHKSVLHPVDFTMKDLQSSAWFGKLVHRAPLVPREQYMNMATRAMTLTPPVAVAEAAPDVATPQQGLHRASSGPVTGGSTPESTPRTSGLMRSFSSRASTPKSDGPKKTLAL